MAKPPPIAPTLRSSRLELRPLTIADVAVAHAMWIDPDMRRYLCDDKVVTVEQARQWLETSGRNFAERRFGLWLLEERASAATIGFAGAQLWGDGAPELMYGLLPAWWRKGLATEAAGAVLDYLFETLGHPVVMAATDPPNVDSIRVMVRLGMTFEWRGEKHGLDTVVYRLSRERWRTQRATTGGPPRPRPDAGRHRLPDLEIRRSAPADADALWAILHAVLATGDSYALPPGTTRADALAYWHPPGGQTFVALDDGHVVGTYVLTTNRPGLGDHVANCGYMVAPAARGHGIAEAMCRHSLEVARGLGFRAMQFNAVVSTNLGAIRVWERCGFTIVGTVPGAHRHPVHGDVAVHVMHRWL